MTSGIAGEGPLAGAGGPRETDRRGGSNGGGYKTSREAIANSIVAAKMLLVWHLRTPLLLDSNESRHRTGKSAAIPDPVVWN